MLAPLPCFCPFCINKEEEEEEKEEEEAYLALEDKDVFMTQNIKHKILLGLSINTK